MTKVTMENNSLNEIPMLSMYPEGAEKLPLVFYIHGYGSNKEQALDFGYMLAKEGFYFVSFDCQAHGTRTDKTNKFSKVYPPETGLDSYVHMHEVIEQTGEDVQRLIEHFSMKKEIDADRTGLTGFSAGGYATFYTAANNTKIKAAVPVGGKPSFYKAWQDMILAASTNKQWSLGIIAAEKETKERNNYFQKLDPVEKMKDYYPKPLLIVNGDQDTVVLFNYSLDLYRDLLPVYAGYPENLQLSIPVIDHHFTIEMKTEVMSWFKKHL